MSKIGKKIFIWILIIIIIPLSISNLGLYFNGRDIVKDQIYSSLEINARRIELSLSTILSHKIIRLRDFSSDGFLRLSLSKLSQQPQSHEIISALENHLITSKIPIDPDIVNIAVYNEEGRLITSAAKRALNAGKYHPPVFFEKISDIEIGDVENDHGERLFSISTPILDSNSEKVLGYLSIRFTASVIDDLLQDNFLNLYMAQTNHNELDAVTDIYIIDKDGTVIVSKKPEFLYKNIVKILQENSLYPDNELIREIKDISGDTLVGFVTKIANNKWTIIVTVPKEKVFIPLDRFTYWSLFSVLIGIISVFSLSSILNKHIARPVMEISRATERIAEGNLDERIKIDNEGDEICQLWHALNYMLIRLEATLNKLKHQEKEAREGELKYKTLMDNLPQREREKEEIENQLRHLQKMEAITQLTSGIAHDFNNMLTAISGNAFILQRKLRMEPELMQCVEDIIYASETAAHLTRRLLTFSRRQVIDIRPASLNHIVSDVNNLLRRIIGEDINLDVKLTETEITILADKGQIEQILVNLTANARDAMPKGGSVSISTEIVNLDSKFTEIHSYGNPGKYALLTVTDTGAGMDEGTKIRMFEPFFTTKEVGKGTGLGLSIVYGIVKQHRGYINVYSEHGIGTTFKLYFPFIASYVSSDFEFGKYMVHMKGTETILLTEDDDKVRILTKRLLEDSGYIVIDTADTEEAISMFMVNKDRIKLVLLDVIMPKRNGKQVYREMASMCPGLKAIFMSGYNEDIIHKNGILDEGSNFVSKPYVPTELLRKIREVLDNPVQDFHEAQV